MAQAWPQGHHIYCHRHRHTNCTEYMSGKVGLTDQQQKPMLAQLSHPKTDVGECYFPSSVEIL